MPHQCTTCSLTFQDGSKQMLGGCPECGGNKFQFLPEGAADRTVGGSDPSVGDREDTQSRSPSPAPASPAPPASPTESSGEPSPSDADIIEAPAEPVEAAAADDSEDRAQASARRAVVSEDELPSAEAGYASEVTAGPTPGDDRPGLTQLREELNDQFESIKILRPGEYELNLMELYDREEYIIALEEDGRYVIDVPDSWRDVD